MEGNLLLSENDLCRNSCVDKEIASQFSCMILIFVTGPLQLETHHVI